MRLRRIIGPAALILTLGAVAALSSGEVPRWTLSGARMQMRAPLAVSLGALLPMPAAGHILFVGDSNTAGSRIGGPALAFPAIFADALGIRSRVSVSAFGGATASAMSERGLPVERPVVAFVLLGTNDAAPRGILSSRRPVPVSDYRHQLAGLIARLQQRGAKVIVLAPPPVGTAAMARRLQPYVEASRQTAIATKSAFRDTAAAFGLPDKEGLLHHDALHLNPEAQRRLGLWLADQTIMASPAGNSSTGNPRPPSASHPS